jgi:glycosyltransferase involved in cell wall biosynthesis
MPGVLTVHDAINLLPLREIIAGHPKRVGTIAKMAYLHFMSTWSVARRPLVITVSEYSKREILRQSGLNPDEIRVVPNAPDAAFRVLPLAETSALRSRYRLREYVLVADAIKNSTAVLSAYRRLDSDVRARTSLVFFSRRVPDAEIVAASDVGECVLALQPTRDELVQLYNLADLLVFPSLYEGFGIPIVEAMKCGTPVIGSDRGAIPEVIGPGGVVVRLEDEMALADAVAALLNRPFRRRELRELALKHAARYSWHATAIATLEVYDDALRRSSVRSLYPTGERVTQ